MSIDTADAVVDVCLTLLAVSGLVSNCLVLVVFYRRPALRSPSNRFVGSLVISNLVSAMVLAPVLVSRIPSVSAALSALVATSTVFSIVAIALDRYRAVLSPLHYAMTVTRRRSLAVIAVTWSLSALLASPHLLLTCQTQVFWLTHSLIVLLLGFTFPLIALVLIYVRMYAAAHRNSLRTRRQSMTTDIELARKSSNATFSALFFREEGRAVKTAFMVIASYLFCWAPYFVSSTSQTWGGVSLPRSLVTLCAVSGSSLNPFVYVFRNESVRKEATRVVCWWRVPPCPPGQPPGDPPKVRHQSSSRCDSMSVQSFQMSTECHHLDTVAPPADFVTTYNPIHGESQRYESVTFRLAQRRCQSCVRQNSDSSTGSGHPLLTPLPRRQRPASEPSTPRHFNNNDTDDKSGSVFKFQEAPERLSVDGESRRERFKLQRLPAIETDDPGTQV